MTEQHLRLVPLGDQAVLAYLADERDAIHFANAVREVERMVGGRCLVVRQRGCLL